VDARERTRYTALSESAIAAAPILALDGAPAWIEQHDALVVDIRSPLAFEMGSIRGAINIPTEALDTLVQSRVPFCGIEKPVVFVCPVGEQSKRYAAQMTKLGATAYSLDGGLQAWRGKGYSLRSEESQFLAA